MKRIQDSMKQQILDLTKEQSNLVMEFSPILVRWKVERNSKN